MNCWHCGQDVPFEPTHCLADLDQRPVVRKIPIGACRRCWQRKPITTIYESPNGHLSLAMCEDCSVVMDSLYRVQEGRSVGAH